MDYAEEQVESTQMEREQAAMDGQMPAFPGTESNGLNSGCPGATLRDYFAAKAMPVAHDFWTRIFYPEICADGLEHPFSTDYIDLIRHSAESSYEMADAMLIARAKYPPPRPQRKQGTHTEDLWSNRHKRMPRKAATSTI